jgi:hypothetical protein
MAGGASNLLAGRPGSTGKVVAPRSAETKKGERAMKMEMSLRNGFGALALGAVLLGGCAAPPPAAAPVAGTDPSTGTITFSGTAVAAGIGFQWGGGVLTYRGANYPFSVSGISVADVGIARVTGSGRVSNLRNLADFNGTFVAATAGATIGGGASAAVLRNQNGVTIDGISTSQGARLTFAAAGVTLTLNR